jgi:hypothetical protein
MFAALHDPNDIDAVGLRLPHVCVEHQKLKLMGQSFTFRFLSSHSGLDRADRKSGDAAIVLVRQPES